MSANTTTTEANVANIQHVFVLMLENRSFDHMFALSGIPGINAATPANFNVYGGTQYLFGGGAPEQMPTDPGHEFTDVVEQLCGPGVQFQPGKAYPPIDSSGYVSNYATTITEGKPPQLADVGKVILGIDTKTQAPALFQLASEFVLCDCWHSSLPGPTWPNRYFLHGASSAGLDHSPSSAEMAEWEGSDGFCYPKGSIFEALGKGNYRLYQDEFGPDLGRVPQVASLKGISLFDVDNLAHLEEDLAAGYSAKYTFIEPSYGDGTNGSYEGGSSQHPMDSLAQGDALVARVYNTIRNSPVWNNSLLIILYDEHGGFYDSAVPISAPPPNDGAGPSLNKYGFKFDTYGVRVPAIIVSPWVEQGLVDHTLYDHSSVPATIEALFDLLPLTDRDRKASTLSSLITCVCRNDCPQGVGK
jgi:phospholipase C